MAIMIRDARGASLREAQANGTRDVVRRALLACGPLSSLLYIIGTDGIGASQWHGYSRTTQMVSDLFAIGSPARPILVVLVVGGYTLFVIACGIGVWASAQGNRSLRFTGAALTLYGASNVVAGFFPLTLGSDASVPLHIAATNLNLILMLATIAFGAAAFPGRMRLYSLATLATIVVAGLAAFVGAGAGPSLLLGIGERISIGAFLLWVAVLAVAVWRTPERGRETDTAPGRS